MRRLRYTTFHAIVQREIFKRFDVCAICRNTVVNMRGNTRFGFNVERPRLISKFPRPSWTVCYYSVLPQLVSTIVKLIHGFSFQYCVCEIGINSTPPTWLFIRYSIRFSIIQFSFLLSSILYGQQFLKKKKKISYFATITQVKFLGDFLISTTVIWLNRRFLEKTKT